jgi:hypothetical protein
MRESIHKLQDFVISANFNDPEKWMSSLESTNWLSYSHLLLNCCIKVTDHIVKGESVLIHCSDG